MTQPPARHPWARRSSDRGWLPVLAVASLAVTGAELALPAMLGRTIDAVLGRHDAAHWLLGSISVIAVLVVAEPVEQFAAGAARATRTARLRRRLVRHLLAIDITHPDRPGAGTGDLVGRVVGGAADAGQAGIAAVGTVTSTLPAIGALVALAWIDRWLLAGYLAGVLLVALLLRVHVQDASDVAVRYQEAQADIAARLADAIAGARTIGAAATAEQEIARCLRPLPRLGAHGRQMWLLLGRSSAYAATLGPLLRLSVVAVGGWELSRGRMSAGELVAAVQYAALGTGLGTVVAAFNALARARAGSRRLTAMFARPARRHGTRALPPGPGRLEFTGVRVGAGDTAAIDGLHLVVPARTTVAVVGPTGAGKSLLAALAAGLVEPDAGEVRLDGVPLRELHPATLRREIGVAFERPVLLGATVGDAVTLAHDPPDADGLAVVLRRAKIDGYVARLPHGADTALDRAPMSGGEAQRLGLARAWHAGRLLVLDDATSSLDTATEAEITELLTRDRSRTQLIVAQRASTAARCDLVVWLEDGRVRRCDPHDVLWRDPAYRSIFQPPDPAYRSIFRPPEPADRSISPPAEPADRPVPPPAERVDRSASSPAEPRRVIEGRP